jgi:hypothetical protein
LEIPIPVKRVIDCNVAIRRKADGARDRGIVTKPD